MKVLLINGSPRSNGNTYLSLAEAASALEAEGIGTEMISIGPKAVQGCTACNKCSELGRCVFKDELYEKVRERVLECDALIIGSPTYYAGPNGSLCALLDRVFYSCGKHLRYKPGAAVAVCRRGGAISTFDRLNRYFTITDMPIVPSQYWNIVYGQQPGDASKDAEGMQTMRKLGSNMAWLLRRIESGEAPPAMQEERVWTNFIR
jgi:multimeric flavodoxin WrbA